MRLGPGRWLNAQMHLLSWLGEELHGESFMAEQRPQGRNVLVKVLSAAACRTPEYLERFRHAAERAMLLNHRHVAAVHAFGLLQGGAEPGIYDETAATLSGSAHASAPSKSAASDSDAPGIPWIASDP